MNDRKKRKKKDTLGTMQIHSTKQYWRWEGVVSDFFVFVFAATLVLNKCHSVLPAQGNIGSSAPRAPRPPKKNLKIVRRTVWLWQALSCVTKLQRATGLPVVNTKVGCFVCKMAKNLASPRNFAESGGRGGGAEFKHQFRPAWWH